MGGYARWVLRHRVSVVVVTTAMTVLLLSAAGNLHVEVDADRQLPQGHPYIDALDRVHELFGDKNLVVVGLFPRDGRVFTPTFLRNLHEVTAALGRVPGANPSLIQSMASPAVKTIRGTANGMTVERIFDSPPAEQVEADAVRERALATDSILDTLVTRDGSAAAIQASFELTDVTPDYQSLHAAVVDAIEKVQDGSFDYALSGPVVFLSQMSAYSSRMVYLLPIALLVIACVHYDAFRTLQGLLLPIVTAVLSVVWAVGLMGLLRVPLDPLNTTTPILILAVGAGHAVQVLKRFYEEFERTRQQDEAIVACITKIGPVMLGAGSVAVLSFWSLLTFETASIRTFGLFTGLGILSAMVIELTVIPAVRSMLPMPAESERSHGSHRHRVLDPLLDMFSRLVHARRKVVGLGVGIVVISSTLLALRVEVDTSLKREFKRSDAVRVDDTRINGSFAGTNTLILLVDGGEEGTLEDPRVLQGIWNLQGEVAKEPEVGKVLSYVDFLSEMHRALNADRLEAGVLPATRELAAQYLFLYTLSGGSDEFDSMINPEHSVAKIRMLVHDDSTRFGQGLIERVKQLADRHIPEGYRVQYTGTIASTLASTQAMVGGKLLNIVQIGLITVTIASILLRSLVGGLLVAVPLALAVLTNFGVMGLLGIPLDNMTAAISAMAVGIGADYAMYFLFRVREEASEMGSLDEAVRRALTTSGKAVLFVSTAVAAGYATLCLSGFAVHVQLGGLVALAMVVSSVGALLVLPALVLGLQPRFIWRQGAHSHVTLASDHPEAA